jgi:hypothetical protein
MPFEIDPKQTITAADFLSRIIIELTPPLTALIAEAGVPPNGVLAELDRIDADAIIRPQREQHRPGKRP